MLLHGHCQPVNRRPTSRCVPLKRLLVCRAHSTSSTTTPSTAPKPSSIVTVPRNIYEVDNGQIMGFGADLAADHPGFHDQVYKQRRVDIANLARSHKIGDPIPRIEYNEQERMVWRHVVRELRDLHQKHACKQFLRTLPLFDFKEDELPQLEDLSQVLQASTGWHIRPVAGLMHPRHFLAGLAFKHFHSTQYIRHPSQPSYTPEPDVVHELIGHVPMLANQEYADLVQAIGLASLGADDKMIWHLTKVYWFTVEFGVVREGDSIKAFGAGVLSSFGELQHMASGKAQLLEFNPFAKQPKMSYRDGYQKSYFVLESFEDASTKLRALADTFKLPEDLRGDPSHA